MIARTEIHLPFAAGVNQKADPKVVEPPVLLVAENVRLTKAGQIAKRRGFSSIVTTGQLGGSVRGIITRDQDILLAQAGGVSMYSSLKGGWYQPEGMASKTSTDGECHPFIHVQTTERAVARGEESVRFCDGVVTSNGYEVSAWMDGTNARVVVRQLSTGRTVMGPRKVDTAADADTGRVRVATIGTTAVVFVVTSSTTIKGYTIDTTSASISVSAGTSVVTDHNSSSKVYDVVSDIGGSHIHICYRSSTPSNTIKKLNSSLSSVASTTFGGTGSNVLGVYQHPDTGDIFVGNGGGTTYSMTSAYGSVTSFTTFSGGLTPRNMAYVKKSSTDVWCVADYAEDTVSYHQHIKVGSFNAAGTGAGVAGSALYHFRLIGRPWLPSQITTSSTPHIPVAYVAPYNSTTFKYSSTQFASFVLTLYAGTTSGGYAQFGVVARFQQDVSLAYVDLWDIGRLPRVSAYGDKYYFTCLHRAAPSDREGTSLAFVKEKFQVGVDLVAVDYAPNPPRYAQVNGCAVIASGTSWTWDGEHITETVPHLYPELVSVADNGSGAANLDAGTYQYRVVAQFEDAQGNLHRSDGSPVLKLDDDPAAPVSQVTLASASTVKVTWINAASAISCRDGASMPAMRWAVYRRRIDAPDDGTVNANAIWKLVAITGGTAGSKSGERYYTDTLDEDGIRNQAVGDFLETDAIGIGEVAVYAPGCQEDIVVAKGRAFAVSSARRDEVLYSHYLTPREAVKWTAEFAIRLTSNQYGTPDVVGLAAIDEKLLVFTKDEVFVVFGDGPDAQGQNDTFTPPVPVHGALGCTDRRSIVSVPQGVMYRTARGIYLLDRAFAPRYVGAPVEDALGTNTIRTATYVREQAEVRFTLSDDTQLRWSTEFEQWMTATSTAFVDAAVINGVYHAVDSSGVVYYEQNTSWTGFYMRVKTAWVKLGGIQGFQRVRRAHLLGEKVSACPLSMKVFYDYESSVAETKSWTESEIDAYTTLRLESHLAKQKCSAVAFEFTEAAKASGTGGGITLTGLSLSLGTKQGLARLTPSGRK